MQRERNESSIRSEMIRFLETVPFLAHLSAESLQQIVPLFREQPFQTDDYILRAGEINDAFYLLRFGRLAVRGERNGQRETLAYLDPPALFGELSCITGSSCTADVQAVVDSDVLVLPREALTHLLEHGTEVMWGLLSILAGRLHRTWTKDTREPGQFVVLLRPGHHWPAPLGFAAELGRCLARQMKRATLVVNLGDAVPSEDLGELDEWTMVTGIALQRGSRPVEASVTERLAAWSQSFANLVVNPVGTGACSWFERLTRLASHQGELLGPGDSAALPPGRRQFVVGTAPHARLPFLSGEQQQIREAAESEGDYRAGRPVRPWFRRTVASIARFICDRQVGLALGGGVAWGLSHVGVLAVLERAEFPIDVVAGCSMGSVVGAMVAAGMDAAQMRRTVAALTLRPWSFLEPCVWRMHLVSDRAVRRSLDAYLGKTVLNEAAVPFWVNALNIQNGQECTLRQGGLADAVRASIAMPGLLPPVPASEGLLVDGGFINPVPVKQIRQMNCRYALAINPMQALAAQPISWRYPLNMLDVMLRCFRISGHEMGAARCDAAADLMLTPHLGNISMLHFHRSAELIEAGEQIGEKYLAAIQEGYERLRPRSAGAG